MLPSSSWADYVLSIVILNVSEMQLRSMGKWNWSVASVDREACRQSYHDERAQILVNFQGLFDPSLGKRSGIDRHPFANEVRPPGRSVLSRTNKQISFLLITTFAERRMFDSSPFRSM